MSIGQVVVFIHELGPTSVKWYYGQLTDKKIFKGAPLKIYSSELKQIPTPEEWVSYLGTAPPTMLEIENPRGFFSTPVGINSWSLITPSNYVIPVLRMLDANPAYKFLVTDLTEMAYTAPIAAQPATTGTRPYAEVKFENKVPVTAAKKKDMPKSVRWANNNNTNSVGAVGKEGEEDADTAAARRMLERAVIGSKVKAKTPAVRANDISSVRAVGKYDNDDNDSVVAVTGVGVDADKVAASASKYLAERAATYTSYAAPTAKAASSVASDWRAAAELAAASEKPKSATVTKAKMIPTANELAERAAAEEADRLKKETALAKRRATLEAKKIAQAAASEKRKATLAAKRLEEEERARKDREGFLAFTAAKLAKGKTGTDSVFSQAGV